MQVKEINQMLEIRSEMVNLPAEVDPAFPYPVGRKRNALTIFLGYTSNLVTSGLRDVKF